MAKRKKGKKENSFMDMIKVGLGYVSQIVSALIFMPMEQAAEKVMNNIEERIIRLEKRIIRDICSLLIIGLGAVFLIFALLFFLTENLGWSKALAFFSIGITVFVIGLLLKLKGYDK